MILAATVFMSLIAASNVAADGRCGGLRGIQVWEDAGFSGRTVVWCQGSGGGIALPDLTKHNENLWFWESWSDRITSFQTFNLQSGIRMCAFNNANYGSYLAPYYDGNHSVDYVGLNNNDKWTSILIAWPQYNYCP